MSEIRECKHVDGLTTPQSTGLHSPRIPANVPRVAVVHDWLEAYAGSERVLEQLFVCFPQADVFAVVDFVPNEHRHFLQGRKVQTSFIQKLPLSRRMFRHYLGLMPLVSAGHPAA
jgi:hypothetical protein